MELAGLSTVTLVHKNYDISLCGKIFGQSVFQIFDVFLVICFRTVAAALSEFMYQRAQKTVIESVQAFKQIFSALSADNIFIHTLVILFNLLIQFLAVGNDQDTRIGIVLQNPLREPHHRQALAAALGMPDDAAALLVRQTVLRPFNGIVLIIAADLFDALIKDHKVVDQIKETLFVKQCEKLFFQLAGNSLAIFLNLDIHNIAFRLMLDKAVVFPFQIVLLRGKQRTIAQALAVVPGHTELDGREEIFDKVRFLVGQILTDAVGHRHTALFQFDHRKCNAIHIDDNIRTLGVVADNSDFFRNIEVIFTDIFKVNKIHRLGGVLHGLLDLGSIFQQAVDLFVGMVQPLLQIGGCLHQGIYCIGCKLFGVALFQ